MQFTTAVLELVKHVVLIDPQSMTVFVIEIVDEDEGFIGLGMTQSLIPKSPVPDTVLAVVDAPPLDRTASINCNVPAEECVQ